MSGYRKPKFVSSQDANHYIVRDFLRDVCGGFEKIKVGTTDVYLANFRGVRVGAMDTSGLGGCWLDWQCFAGEAVTLVEVKTEEAHKKDGNSLTDNEKWTFTNLPLNKRVVCTHEQVVKVYEDLLAIYFAQ